MSDWFLPPLIIEDEPSDFRTSRWSWGPDKLKLSETNDAAQGDGVLVCVLDTAGQLDHRDLPKPIDQRIFTGESSGFDQNAHGCVAPTDLVYTSLCGLQTIETLFERSPGIPHFIDSNGTIIKDTSRFDLRTISLDTEGNTVLGKITAVHKLKHSGKVFKVKTNSGELTLTPWHPVYIVRSSTGSLRRVTKKRADELKKGDRIVLPARGVSVGDYVNLPFESRYVCNACGHKATGNKRRYCRKCNARPWNEGLTTKFIKLDEKLAYFAGLIASDGHITKNICQNDYSIQFSQGFSNIGDRLVEEFRRLSKELFGLEASVFKNKTGWSARIYSKDVHTLLNSMGIPYGNKSNTIDLPEIIAKSPRSVICSFFAGVIEGDGCVRDTIRIATGSEKFAKKSCELLKMLGIKSHVSKQSRSSFGKKKVKLPGFIYYIGLSADEEILSYIRVKDTSVCNVPKNTKDSIGSSEIFEIIEEDYDGYMYDFTVEGHHNYVANGHIVSNTHVSGTVHEWAPKADLAVYKVLRNNGSGSTTGIANAIRYVTHKWVNEWRDNKYAFIIVNMSLGGGFAQDIDNAMRDGAEEGVLYVCAAGNSGNSGIDHPGSSRFSALTVGAFDSQLRPASFSSRGPAVNVAMPGVNINSTIPNNRFQTFSGTCLAQGSYVYGVDGPIKIEDILPGDTIFSYEDGNRVSRVVSNVIPQGRNRVFQVTASGRDVLATEEHQFLAISKSSKDLEWVKVKDINPDNHRLLIPKELPLRVNPYIDSVVSEEFAYLLGYFLGDGWISATSGGKRVCVAEDEKIEYMEKVLNYYETVSGKKMRLAKNGRWFYDDSTRLALIFEVAGLNGYSQEKTIPFWVWQLSINKQDSFIKGYTDADGHHSKSGHKALECSSPDLVRRLACLVDYRGWKRGFVRHRERLTNAPNQTKTTASDFYALTYCFDNKLVEPDMLFWNKSERWFKDMGVNLSHYTHSKPKIKDVGITAEVYDISVPGSNNFFTQGLVTHNSMSAPGASGLSARMLSSRPQDKHLRDYRKFQTFIYERCQDLHTPGRDTATGFGFPIPSKVVDFTPYRFF